MDPRERADALLARARARGAFVVTPDDATSPMDASNTVQIPRDVVNRIDRGEDPDTTAVVPASVIDSVRGSLQEKPDTRVNMAPVTQPLRHPNAQAPASARGSAQSPAQNQGQTQGPARPREQEVEGLIPTTTQSTGRSDLSRRLEGL